MNERAVRWVLTESTATASERLVLVALAWAADPDSDDWQAWPSVAEIGALAGIPRERTVTDVLSRLVADGRIERVLNGAPVDVPVNRRPNLYRILTRPQPPPKAQRRPVRTVPPLSDTPTQESPGQAPKSSAAGGRGVGVMGSTDVTTRTTPNQTPGLTRQETTPQLIPDPAPAPKVKAPDPYAQVAQRLAEAEWERLPQRPVVGFLALRARIKEALEAGYTEAEIGAALPCMKGYSRNSFDFQLRKTERARPARPDPKVDDDRQAPSGEVLL